MPIQPFGQTMQPPSPMDLLGLAMQQKAMQRQELLDAFRIRQEQEAARREEERLGMARRAETRQLEAIEQEATRRQALADLYRARNIPTLQQEELQQAQREAARQFDVQTQVAETGAPPIQRVEEQPVSLLERVEDRFRRRREQQETVATAFETGALTAEQSLGQQFLSPGGPLEGELREYGESLYRIYPDNTYVRVLGPKDRPEKPGSQEARDRERWIDLKDIARRHVENGERPLTPTETDEYIQLDAEQRWKRIRLREITEGTSDYTRELLYAIPASSPEFLPQSKVTDQNKQLIAEGQIPKIRPIHNFIEKELTGIDTTINILEHLQNQYANLLQQGLDPQSIAGRMNLGINVVKDFIAGLDYDFFLRLSEGVDSKGRRITEQERTLTEAFGFRAGLWQEFNRYRKWVTGAQASMAELQWMLQSFPNPDMKSGRQLLGSMKATIGNLNLLRKSMIAFTALNPLQDIYAPGRRGGDDPSIADMPIDFSPAYRGFMRQFKPQFMGLDTVKEDIAKEIKRLYPGDVNMQRAVLFSIYPEMKPRNQ